MRVNQVVTATTAPVNASYAFASWTGGPVTPGSGAGAGGAVGTLVMDGPKSVTANFNVAYTVTTVPEGLSVMVDWVTYTTPKTFGWAPGSVHWLYVSSSAQTKAGETGTRYEYQSWSDGQAQLHCGDDAPGVDDVYGDIREAVQFDDVIESCGWGYGGSCGGELVECRGDDIGCDGDGECGVPVYGLERGLFIDGESRAGDRDGRTEGIDGEFWEDVELYGDERTCGPSGGGGRDVTYTTPQVFNWLPGTNHTIGVTSPQMGVAGTPIPVSGLERSGGSESYGDGASDGDDVYGDVRDAACGDGCGESLRSGDVDAESCGVEVEGGRSWYAVNQVVTATTAPVSASYAFASWTGGPVTPGSGAGAGGAVGTLVMDGPKSVTANFNVAYTVTTVPEGLSVMVDWVTYTTPKTFGWAPGSVHWLYVSSSVADEGR